MPRFVQALRSILDSLGLAKPRARSIFSYAKIAAMFSSPPPLRPTDMERMLELLDDCEKSGPVTVVLALAGAMFGESLYDLVPRAGAAEPTRSGRPSRPETGGEVELVEWCGQVRASPLEAQVEKIGEESAGAEDILERDEHDECCSQAGAIPLEEAEVRIEKDLIERMEMEAKIEKELVERMEMDANVADQKKHTIDLDLSAIDADILELKEDSPEFEEEEVKGIQKPRDLPDVMNISDYSLLSEFSDLLDITYSSDDMGTVISKAPSSANELLVALE